jgi:hypothetical protein
MFLLSRSHQGLANTTGGGLGSLDSNLTFLIKVVSSSS